MIDISYHITGADQTIAELQRIRVDALRPTIADTMDAIAADAANYPPERAGQRYRRSNRLHDEWIDGQTTFPQSDPTLLEALRENSTPHGPYVQGAEDQAKVHQGRWKTTDSIMEAWGARVAQAVEDALGNMIGP